MILRLSFSNEHLKDNEHKKTFVLAILKFISTQFSIR